MEHRRSISIHFWWNACRWSDGILLLKLRRIDWSSPLTAWVVAVLSFLARLPNALSGLGFDGDSGLFVVQALLSAERGYYLPSRAPGYFLPDMLAQALAGYGVHWLCLLNSALYALTVPVFAALLRELNGYRCGWLLIAYAFLPLAWVACSDVMVEYSLCLLGVIIGWLYTLRGSPLLAGFCLGCGAAMRPSQGVFLYLIFAMYWLMVWRRARGFIAVGIGLSALVALWVVPVAGLTGRMELLWNYLPYEASWQQHVMRAGSRLVGAVGAVGLFAIALISADALRRLRQSGVLARTTLLSFAVVGLIVVLFLRHPFKMNYLLLAMPFGLVGAAVLSRPPLVAFLGSALVLHNLLGVPSLGRLTTRHDAYPVGWGLAVRDYIERRDFPTQLEQLVAQAPPRSVIGVQEATVWFLVYETLQGRRPNWQVSNSNEVFDPVTQRRFVLIGDKDSAEYWRQREKSVYATTGVLLRLNRDFSYDARKAGYRVIQATNIGL